MYIASVQVTLRPSILDPQGKAVEHAMATLGVGSITHVRMGKVVEMKVNTDDEAAARTAVEEVCRKLLANPVMEDFTFQLHKA